MSGKNNLTFSVQKKKTPFQRHKDLEDEKKKQAGLEAAKLYEEFVESFAGPDAPAPGPGAGGGGGDGGPKAFVRGGTVMPGTSANDASNNSSRGKAGTKYVPSFMPPSGGGLPRPKAFDDSLEEPAYQAPPSSKRADKDKPRNIDKMLETMKREQEAREELVRAKREGRAPIGDLPLGMMMDDDRHTHPDTAGGDPHTTNLYVGNLAPDVDEKILEREFGRFGPIASVKIMWPRDDEQRAKKRNCGFVAFMKREDAQASMDRMNNIVLHDYEMKIGWSKAVALPSVAMYPGTKGALAAAAAAGLVVPGGAAAALREAGHVPWASLATVAAQTPMAAPAGVGVHQWSTGDKNKGVQGLGPDIEVIFPEDGRLRFIIESLALYVLRDGCAFEQAVMEAEQGNPEYAFLFDLEAPEHVYYRWRLCSLAEGDSLRSWRIEPFLMVSGGQRWLPPSMTAADITVRNAVAKASEVAAQGGGARVAERQLSDLEHDKFGTMLRSLTVERADIGAAMVFALDNADASADVVEVLAQSLTLAETPVPTKVARLFLASDILHNATAPVRNASRYRSRLEAVLPDIFESLHETHSASESRMTQEALRRHVLRVLRLWRERFLYSNEYLNGLQATFLQDPVAADDVQAGAGGNEALALELVALSEEDLERRCRFNGLATRGGREAQAARLLRLDLYVNADSRPAPATASGLQSDGNGASGGLGGGGGGSGAFARGALAFPPTPHRARVEEEDEELFPEAGPGMKQEPMEGPEAAVAPVAPPPQRVPVSVPTSRWMTIDEDEEKLQAPQVPISKWLMDEQQQLADRQQQEADAERATSSAAAAAAAMAHDSAGSDGSSDDERGPSAPGDAAGGALGSGGAAAAAAAGAGGGVVAAGGAMDEERRKRLREVELQVARYEAELEEQGMSAGAIQALLVQRRATVSAELDKSDNSKALALEKWRSAKRERDKERTGSGKGGGREEESAADGAGVRSRSRSRSRDAGRRREADKERHKDRTESASKASDSGRDKERGRDKDGARDKDSGRRSSMHKDEDDAGRSAPSSSRRDSAGGKMERSGSAKDREKEREKEKDKEREKEREKDREREKKEKEREKEKEKEKDKEREKAARAARRASRSPDRDKDKGRRSRSRERSKRDRGGSGTAAAAAAAVPAPSRSRSRSASPSRHRSKDSKKSRNK